jgi:hypothetical protein
MSAGERRVKDVIVVRGFNAEFAFWQMADCVFWHREIPNNFFHQTGEEMAVCLLSVWFYADPGRGERARRLKAQEITYLPQRVASVAGWGEMRGAVE